MPWVRLDDRFPTNRKVRLLSDGAFRLYVSAICWSAENLTDGRIKAAELRLVADVRSAKKRADELVEAGLWEPTDDGWLIHDYHEYQPTAARVHAERKAKTARQQRWREKKNSDQPPPPSPGDAPRAQGADGASARPAPSRASKAGARRQAPSRAEQAPVPATFQPSAAALAWADEEGHLARLGGRTGLAAVTAAFVDWHQAKGTVAADPEALWRKWVREQRANPAAPAQGAFLVPLPGGGQGSRREAARADLDTITEELRQGGSW
ncbi:hypothetical protein ACF1DY_01805 [Streptomyces albus]